MCEHLHCLPSPGGLYDQDCLLVAGMDLVVAAQETRRQIEEKKAEHKRR
jgi:hypothetical protein